MTVLHHVIRHTVNASSKAAMHLECYNVEILSWLYVRLRMHTISLMLSQYWAPSVPSVACTQYLFLIFLKSVPTDLDKICCTRVFSCAAWWIVAVDGAARFPQGKNNKRQLASARAGVTKQFDSCCNLARKCLFWNQSSVVK